MFGKNISSISELLFGEKQKQQKIEVREEFHRKFCVFGV